MSVEIGFIRLALSLFEITCKFEGEDIQEEGTEW
jgi:hypothetical protein